MIQPAAESLALSNALYWRGQGCATIWNNDVLYAKRHLLHHARQQFHDFAPFAREELAALKPKRKPQPAAVHKIADLRQARVDRLAAELKAASQAERARIAPHIREGAGVQLEIAL